MPKFIMFSKTLILFWYLMSSHVSEDVWDLWHNWKGVNERSIWKIIFKHYNHKTNLKQHNNQNNSVIRQWQHGFHDEWNFYSIIDKFNEKLQLHVESWAMP